MIPETAARAEAIAVRDRVRPMIFGRSSSLMLPYVDVRALRDGRHRNPHPDRLR